MGKIFRYLFVCFVIWKNYSIPSCFKNGLTTQTDYFVSPGSVTLTSKITFLICKSLMCKILVLPYLTRLLWGLKEIMHVKSLARKRYSKHVKYYFSSYLYDHLHHPYYKSLDASFLLLYSDFQGLAIKTCFWGT